LQFFWKIYAEKLGCDKKMVFTMADLHLSLAGQNKSMEIFGGRWQDYVNKIERNWNKIVGEADSVVIPGDISWGQAVGECREDFEFLNNKLNGTKYILKGNHDYWWDTAAKMTRVFEENNFDKIKILHNNAYICENYIICGSRGWFVDAGASRPNEDEAHTQKILKREAIRLDLSVQAAKKLQVVGADDPVRPKNQDNVNHERTESSAPTDKIREIIAFLHYPPVWGNYICEEIIDVLERAEIKRCYFGHIHNVQIQKIKSYKNINLELISADYLNFTPLKI